MVKNGKKQLMFILGVVAISVLMFNNSTQALVTLGIMLDKSIINIIALLSLCFTIYYLIIKD